MTPAIRQSVLLAAPPDVLFDAYLSRRGHAAVTGGKVTVSSRPGSRFSAFDGVISGRILEVLPKRLIVQSWRSAAGMRTIPTRSSRWPSRPGAAPAPVGST